MNLNEWRTESAQPYQGSQVALTKVFSKVYLWMTTALLITALTAYYLASSGLLISILTNRALFWGLAIAELGVVWYLSSRIFRLSIPTATILLILYSVLNGATVGAILMLYTRTSIYATFAVTAGMFGVMSLVGFFTKSDLSRWNKILMMGLVGVILATIVNVFMQWSLLHWIVSFAGVAIFTILTVVDTNKIKHWTQENVHEQDHEMISRIAILGALSLYLDFINLFLYLLRFLGSRD